MRKTYVVSAIGSFLGSLTTVKPVDLGATVVKALLEDAKVAPENVDELLCGNVLSAGLGQNIARQVALAAGIPETVCSHSVNMVFRQVSMKSLLLVVLNLCLALLI